MQSLCILPRERNTGALAKGLFPETKTCSPTRWQRGAPRPDFTSAKSKRRAADGLQKRGLHPQGSVPSEHEALSRSLEWLHRALRSCPDTRQPGAPGERLREQTLDTSPQGAGKQKPSPGTHSWPERVQEGGAAPRARLVSQEKASGSLRRGPPSHLAGSWAGNDRCLRTGGTAAAVSP